MHDSMTIADVGSIVNVSGSRIATPFGPPSPGSTPTNTPSTSPTIISASVFQVSRTAKPCINRPKASMQIYPYFAHDPIPKTAVHFSGSCASYLAAKSRFQRALRHDDVKGDIEGHEHDGREQEGGEQRFPQRDPSDHAHEGGDQQEARDIEPEILHGETKQQRRNEHRHDAPQLRPGDEGLRGLLARQPGGNKAIEAGAGEAHRQIKREIAGLRAGRIPGNPGA